MLLTELKDFLDEKADTYNHPSFIDNDPISLPHQFSEKEDIEIIGFLVATIAWGNRKMIIKSGENIKELMGNCPYDFIMEYTPQKKDKISSFKHRTFNANDLHYFFLSLQNIYKNHGGLEIVFAEKITPESKNVFEAIDHFRTVFFEIANDENKRTEKHVASPMKGSSAKRINMLLRWLCRKDKKGVDFGIWNSIPMSVLSCPLDVHTGNVARELGLISRNQNDLKALIELDSNLRKLDPTDPVKYDFALFGLGIDEKFAK